MNKNIVVEPFVFSRLVFHHQVNQKQFLYIVVFKGPTHLNNAKVIRKSH